MNSGAVAERIYGAVKRRIISGAMRHGERIDIAALAQELDSSATPVRDALHLLVGERLIETRAGDGFQVPQLDAPALNDLYQWNMDVLLQLLRRKTDSGTQGRDANEPAAEDAGDMVGSLFARIAARSGNVEHAHAIGSINDRLHAVRIAEASVFPDWREEIAGLSAEIQRDNVPAMRRLIMHYHRRRARCVTDIVRARQQLSAMG
jgi:DNA-binding transcriptional regulator YhcF (GntR family)